MAPGIPAHEFPQETYFSASRRRGIGQIGSALNAWSHKLRWRYKLQDAEAPPYWRRYGVPARAPMCEPGPEELEQLIGAVTNNFSIYAKLLCADRLDLVKRGATCLV